MTLGQRTVAALQWGLLIAAVGILEWGARSGVIDRLTFVPIGEIWKSLVAGLSSGRFLPQLLYSGQVMVEAFLLAVGLGIPLGYALSRTPRVYGWIRPYIESYYCLPIFVFYPVAVAMMGLSRWPALIIVWMWAVGGVIVNTVIGFNRVPASLEKYCRSVHLSEWRKIMWMRLPAAFPSILTGIKLAVVYSISGTVGVEFILSSRGVGRLINYAFSDFRTAEMYSLILIVLAVAAVCHLVLDRIESRLLKLRGRAVDHGGAMTAGRSLGGSRGGFSPNSRRNFAEMLVVPAILLVLWYALVAAVGADKLAPPTAAVAALWDDFRDGSLMQVFDGTIRDTFSAFAISTAIGLALGAAFGRSEALRKVFGPWITATYTVPKIVLFPILLFLFGLGSTSRIAYGVLHAAPAIMLFTIAGILAVNPGHMKYATSVQLSQWKVFRFITLPSALPEIISGLRLGLGMCFLGVLVGEMLFGASDGTGYAIVHSAIANDTPRLMALVVSVFLLVLSMNYIMGLIQRVVDHAHN